MAGVLCFTQTVHWGPRQAAQLLPLRVPTFFLQLSFCLAKKAFILSKMLMSFALCSQPYCSEMGALVDSAGPNPISQDALLAAHLRLVRTPLYSVLGMKSCRNFVLGWQIGRASCRERV